MMTTYCKIFHEWSQATNELHEFLEQLIRWRSKESSAIPIREIRNKYLVCAQPNS